MAHYVDRLEWLFHEMSLDIKTELLMKGKKFLLLRQGWDIIAKVDKNAAL